MLMPLQPSPDDETAPFVEGFERALESGSVMPLIDRFGMDGIARLLRVVPVAERGHAARMLFSMKPPDVRQAVRLIVHANSKDQ